MIEPSTPFALETTFEDDRLVAEVTQNPSAFGALYNRYLVSVYRYLFSRVGNAVDAEDLTSQVFLTAFERFRQYRGGGKFAAWLFTIARNKTFDYFRTHRREIPLDGESDTLPIDKDSYISLGESSAILELIAGFPAEERELLELRFAAEMPYREIGQMLHRSEGSVKKQIYRLLERIETELKKRHE